MRVALIDGAVNSEFLQSIENPNVRMLGTYAVSGGSVIKEQMLTREITHASVCAGIFLSEVRCPCELLCIRVLDADSLRGNIHALITALDFCMSSRIDVVNLSLGTTRIQDGGLLHDKVIELERHRIVIVAAESNRNLLTFPAAFEYVIGVREDASANRKHPSDGILYRSTVRSFSYQGKTMVTGGYNSYAAPAVTAMVCGCLVRGITETNAIRQELLRQGKGKESKKRRSVKAEKPVICLYVRNREEAVRRINKILGFFNGHGYEGICISDVLQTAYDAGILNIGQFKRGVCSLNHRLGLLTNAADADFVIWYMTQTELNRRNRRSIDMTVTDGPDYGRMFKANVVTGCLDEEKLSRMLKCLT